MVLGNFNLSETVRFADTLKGLANPMLSVLYLFLSTMFSVFRSQAARQVENLALRQQIGVLRRSAKKRPKLTVADRVFWTWLSRTWADWRSALVIVKPETVLEGPARNKLHVPTFERISPCTEFPTRISIVLPMSPAGQGINGGERGIRSSRAH